MRGPFTKHTLAVGLGVSHVSPQQLRPEEVTKPPEPQARAKQGNSPVGEKRACIGECVPASRRPQRGLS